MELELEAASIAIERLEQAWLPVVIPPDPELHTYEPLRINQWMDMLRIAIKVATGQKYLEVGSGIGTKLLMAAIMGLEAHGIENRETYVAIARYILDQPPQSFRLPSIEIADARHFSRYAMFDIVYAYRPIVKEEGQILFESMLTQQMRSGSVLMNPCRPHMDGWIPTEHEWVWIR